MGFFIMHKNTKHGMRKTPEYDAWRGMKKRCTLKSRKDYSYYGGRGITVCERWFDSFENFYKDMGDRPEGMTLDRIDPEGNYDPFNCRWADATTQSRNQRTSSKNTSGTKGVYWCNSIKKWRARISTGSKRISLGNYDDLNEAIIARKQAENKYWNINN